MKTIGKRQLLITVFLGCAWLLIPAVSVFCADFVSVAKDGVNLRSGPDTKYSILFELPAGYPLKVISKNGQWLKVSDFENDQGWVYAPLVSKEPYVVVTAKLGNVRSAPGVNNDKIGEVVREVILRQVKRKGNWIQVEHPRLKGWIHKKLVWP